MVGYLCIGGLDLDLDGLECRVTHCWRLVLQATHDRNVLSPFLADLQLGVIDCDT